MLSIVNTCSRLPTRVKQYFINYIFAETYLWLWDKMSEIFMHFAQTICRRGMLTVLMVIINDVGPYGAVSKADGRLSEMFSKSIDPLEVIVDLWFSVICWDIDQTITKKFDALVVVEWIPMKIWWKINILLYTVTFYQSFCCYFKQYNILSSVYSVKI